MKLKDLAEVLDRDTYVKVYFNYDRFCSETARLGSLDSFIETYGEHEVTYISLDYLFTHKKDSIKTDPLLTIVARG